MTIANWLSPEVMRPVGWALLHFLWEGTALAAIAALAMALLHRSSARYLVAVSVLGVMLVAPVATFFYYRDATTVTPGTTHQYAHPVASVLQPTSFPAVTLVSRRVPLDLFPWIVNGWLAGVVFFSMRGVGGLIVVERLRRRQSTPLRGNLRDLCLNVQTRLGVRRAIHYC